MANTKKERTLEINVAMSDLKYTLYVKDGKPIRIRCEYVEGGYTIYPHNPVFNGKCEQIINHLFYKEKSYSLKQLYDVLEDGNLKSLVKEKIDKLIAHYEKALKNLKS